MTVYAQFYGKRTWHIVHNPPVDGRFNTRDIATVCGEPSINTNPGQGPMIMRGATPDKVCPRCEKRNR